MKLSIIIPIFNAELFILETLNNLVEWKTSLNYKAEIILVNDGSTDTTLTILEDFINGNTDLILISYASNKGKGFAVKKGMMAAKGEFRIFTDADIPYGFSQFNNIIHYLDFKEFDLCIGNRKSVNSEYFVKMSFLRKLSSKLFTMFISRYVVTGVNDTQCGLKGFKADIADKIFSKLLINGFAFDVEVLYLSFKYEFEIKRIPVKFQGNDISTIKLFNTSFHMFVGCDILANKVSFIKKILITLKLSRNFTNSFNWILDNIVPPVFRDSRIIMLPFFYLLFGKKHKSFMDFKENILTLNDEQIIDYYKDLSSYHIQRESDLNKESVNFIVNNIEGKSILDISCGRGFLAKEIAKKNSVNVVGIDFIIPDGIKDLLNPKFIESSIEKIPFEDNYFDTVISTHTLEHVVDIQLAISELRRVCKNKLIIVLPRQRIYKYTFDLHLHFFPYKYSVLSLMGNKGTCHCLKNDWIYVENYVKVF